jgi:putative sak protein
MGNYFEELNAVNVNDKTEQKNGLTYLAWAYAWGEVKKRYPEASYVIYENAQGWNYHTDGRTCWVKTGVSIEGIEHIEELPVMNNRNQSIPLENVTSCDVNKAIQRSLTKACARHGLGLYIYAGEDLPENEKEEEENIPIPAQKTAEERSVASDVRIAESGRKLTVKQHQLASKCPNDRIIMFMNAIPAKSYDELTEQQYSDLIAMVKAYKPAKD